jgi:hypothetical protein
MPAMFLGSLNIALLCILVAAEKADDNLRRIEENRSNDGGWLNDD